jgi:hypothetical protein
MVRTFSPIAGVMLDMFHLPTACNRRDDVIGKTRKG